MPEGKKMQVAYVSGPYRGPTIWDVKLNIERAERVAADLWRMGYAVICPHKNSAFFDGLCPDEAFLEGDLEILRRCDLVVLVSGWRRSEGARAEVSEANRIGMPVYEWGEIERERAEDAAAAGNL